MKTMRIVVFFLYSSACMATAYAFQVPGPLVETDWLAAHQKDVVILDVRADTKSFTRQPMFYQDKKSGKKVLARVGGHIPGANMVDFGKAREKRQVGDLTVDKLVPEKADFEKLMQASGLSPDSAVVIVTKGESNGDMTMGARMYWQLKYFGHDNVTLLNGGMAQWINDGREVSVEPSNPAPGRWVATAERREILATSEDVAKAVETGSAQLVDNRPISQYLGTNKRSYVFAKGHIPGAKNYPNELMTEADGPAKFLPADQLRQLAEAMNVKTDASSITYCNSGHLAAGGWFIMSELLGNKNVKLYDGSMHEWTLGKRPVSAMKME